jgi:transposase-like protein
VGQRESCCESPEAIAKIWSAAASLLCVVRYLVLSSLRYASKECRDRFTKDLEEANASAIELAVTARFAEFEQAQDGEHPAIVWLWRSPWDQFTPSPGGPTPKRPSCGRTHRRP